MTTFDFDTSKLAQLDRESYLNYINMTQLVSSALTEWQSRLDGLQEVLGDWRDYHGRELFVKLFPNSLD